ncbi:hypothetical protein HD806DRAFT_532278 [Xylariaceae sp. AK1471]|nr:hypothetical protein HD806DRAFT_532278 [Xylariaceae sp. AK1471]
MDRIAAGPLLVAVCVVILLHLWSRYKRQPFAAHSLQQVKRSPFEVLYPGPTDPDKVEVDIIAVHGLGSNVYWAWTWQDRHRLRPPVHWLKDLDMLPAIIPNARILVHSYESRWHAKAPKTRLELCGEELVMSLHRFRREAPDCPVLFVGHSLGGLVVAYGLLFADRTEELKYLPRRTIGFVTLGRLLEQFIMLWILQLLDNKGQ